MFDPTDAKKEAKDRVFVIRHVIHQDRDGGAIHSINMGEHFPELGKEGRYPIKMWFLEPMPLGIAHARAGCQVYRDFLLSFGVGKITIDRITFDADDEIVSTEVIERYGPQGDST